MLFSLMSKPYGPSVLVLAAVLHATSSHAGRPLETEDAGVLGRGECEVEGVAGRIVDAGVRTFDAGLQLGCGLGWSSQVALRSWIERAAGVNTPGADVTGKTRVWRADSVSAQGHELTLAWGLRGTKPTGSSWRHAATETNLVLSSAVLADVGLLHVNTGYARDHLADEGATTWGLAYEHVSAERWTPMAEVFGDDRSAPWWNTGLRLTAIPDKVVLDLSYGRQIHGGRPVRVTAGFKVSF